MNPASHRLRSLLSLAAVAACASTEVPHEDAPDASASVPAVREPDAGQDAGEVGVEGRPCADCEHFPDVCSPDALCLAGPSDPASTAHLDPNVTISVIRGRSAVDVWAVGALGAVAHFDGTSWATSDLGSRESLRSLWLREVGEVVFSYPKRVYTRGMTGIDAGATPSGGGWSFNVPSAPTLVDNDPSIGFSTAWGAPDADWLWITATSTTQAGLWRMGQTPSGTLEARAAFPLNTCRLQHCTSLYAVHGGSADEVWAVGAAGAAVRVVGADGDTPSVQAFNTRTFNSLLGVWVASSDDVWAVGGKGTIRRYRGDPVAWEVVSDVPTTGGLRAVWGSSSDDVWAVGEAGLVLHYDGQAWSRVKVAGLGLRRPDLTTVWVPAPGHVWVGGEGVILSLGGKP